MIEDEEKVCRNCKHRKRTASNSIFCKDHCDIDGHFINYVSYFTGTCDHWKKGKEDETKIMTDTFEITLNNPLTEEQWDMINDVDFDRTDRISFHTKHGKEVEFTKVRHGKWLVCGTDEWEHFYALRCSECYGGYHLKYEDTITWRYCPDCGAMMDAERKE